MPPGLTKVMIIGTLGFFFGAVLLGWLYG